MIDPKELKPNEFQCADCGEVFEFGWTDEEAKAEALKNFGTVDVNDMATICDDCYNKLIPKIFN